MKHGKINSYFAFTICCTVRNISTRVLSGTVSLHMKACSVLLISVVENNSVYLFVLRISIARQKI
jgi:hypothetical protein